MDEALMLCAVDISGRPYLGYDVDIPAARVGDFDTELAEEFWLAFVRHAGMTLHFRMLAGKNSHHIIEAQFKAAARVLAKACAVDAAKADQIPSTKGVL
jgi:imidazoleglycerol-phosphate dehydratase